MIYNQATTWKCRPSELLGIDDDYLAFCADQVVFYVGSTIKGDLDGVEGKNAEEINQKRSRVLDKYFGDEDTQARGYADPAMFFK